MFLGFNPSCLLSRHVAQKNQIPRAPQAVISIEPSSTIEVFRSINCRKDFAETRCFLLAGRVWPAAEKADSEGHARANPATVARLRNLFSKLCRRR
jgi:hypothetical protein